MSRDYIHLLINQWNTSLGEIVVRVTLILWAFYQKFEILWNCLTWTVGPTKVSLYENETILQHSNTKSKFLRKDRQCIMEMFIWTLVIQSRIFIETTDHTVILRENLYDTEFISSEFWYKSNSWIEIYAGLTEFSSIKRAAVMIRTRVIFILKW